ncbi:MAG: hypothetical protein JSU00_13355 [Acidobacteria bacterium]|nr:hypothetical protein [Acidobacteriota bacterium]
MSTVSSTNSSNPMLSSLLETLSNVKSPVLSSPKAMAALESASPEDIVKLSVSATQLESVSLLFGDSSGDGGSTDLSSTLAAIAASLTKSGGSADGTTDASTSGDASSTAASTSASDLKTAALRALLGSNSGDSSSDSILSMLG